MKAYITILLLSVITAASFTAVLTSSAAQTSEVATIGIKVGDWIEYDITVTGKGSPPPTHDVVHFRIEIIEVEDETVAANFTANYRNGTVGSAVWHYNYTEGAVGGWTIIPGNLSPGMQFYDSSIHNHRPVNVTIQRQEDITLLGATRTVTYANDSFRHKEWDKATGVFVWSTETYRNVTNKDGWYIEDLTATVEAVATNMWETQTQHIPVYVYFGVAVASAAAVLIAVIALRRRKIPAV
jgi:hypothetical protein